MRFRNITGFLGSILMILGGCMAVPVGWSLYYGDKDWPAFLVSGALTFVVGLLVYKTAENNRDLTNREAFLLVTLSWLLAAVFGTLPFLLTGTVNSFTDAFFESMSGFTTTGSSVLSDIEALSHGILFWRSMTHWLGGMGIIVLLLAVMANLGAGGMQVFRREVPGHAPEKIRPRLSETAKLLWYTYLAFTAVETVLLWAAGMSLFDAICHAFGTLATGGASTKNASIGFYNSPLIHWVITLFMFISGTSFALSYQALRGKSLRTFWRSEEFRLYTLIILGSTFLVTINLLCTNSGTGLGTALQQACFQVVAVTTTTAYTTVDFNGWPLLSQGLLVALMFVGGCSGSTGGSIKVGRILVLLKQTVLEFVKAIHPKAVTNLRIDGNIISNGVVINVLQFFFVYVAIMVAGTLVMAAMGLDLVSALTAAAASLGNVGPGLGAVGPAGNYGFLPDAGKYFLAFLMMLGRLELFTVLVLAVPSFWRAKSW